MKRKTYWGLLALEAVACSVFISQVIHSSALLSVFALPYSLIGDALWAMSSCGIIMSLLAIVIYVVLSLLPVGYLLAIRKKRAWYPEDWLLVLSSLLLFFVIFLMINTGYIPRMVGAMATGSIGKGILGNALNSVFVGYLVLRALRYYKEAKTKQLAKYLSVLLAILNAIFVLCIFGTLLNQLVINISSLLGGNTQGPSGIGVSCFFLILQYCVSALPYVLDIVVVTLGISLLKAFGENPYSENTHAASKKISQFCITALMTTVLASMGFNLMQLVFATTLLGMNSVLTIPVFSMAFVLATLFLTSLLSQTKELKEENELYI